MSQNYNIDLDALMNGDVSEINRVFGMAKKIHLGICDEKIERYTKERETTYPHENRYFDLGDRIQKLTELRKQIEAEPGSGVFDYPEILDL